MNFHLKVWRQKDKTSAGKFQDYQAKNIPDDASFLEMLDIVNEDLIAANTEPIVFDHDCREGICGMCSLTVNGTPHGPGRGTTCQIYMRKFHDGETIWIEPFRVGAFPVVKDLAVDRSAFDRIIEAGGFITERTGSAPDGNAMPISKEVADRAMDSAACIGCGACAAACPNGSPMLFVGAKISHLNILPQGKAEKDSRARKMVQLMSDNDGFGGCTNFYECEAVCPAHISAAVIAQMNREYDVASLKETTGNI